MNIGLLNINKQFKHWKRFLITVFQRYNDDGCNYRAAGLSYTTLLSIVPLMTVSFAVFSAFPVFESLNEQVQKFIFDNFVAASGEVVHTYIQSFVSKTSQLSVIGLFFLMVASVLMMFTLEQTFNSIWRVRERRHGVSAILIYWAILTLGPIFMGLSILVSTYIASLPIVTQTAENLGITNVILMIMPFLFSTAAFTIFYVAIPNCTVPIRYGFIGAIVAAVLFEIAKKSFAYYVAAFPTYTLIYGALAIIPIFLVWIYVTWMIILFGAEITNVLTTGHHYRTKMKLDGFTHAYQWLGYFWRAMQQGKSLSLHELIELDEYDYAVEPEKQLSFMLNAKLIQPAEYGRYVLSRDLASYSLNDFISSLPWRLPNKQELEISDGEWHESLSKVINEMQENNKQSLNLPLVQFYRTS